MQPDRRLIQDIADSDQSGSDLRSQTDPLCLSSGQGCRCTGKRQVIQTYIAQERDPASDFLQNLLSDHLLLRSKLQILHKVQKVPHGQTGHIVNIPSAHRHSQRFLLQALPAADLTGTDAHKLLIFLTHPLTGLLVPAVGILHQTLKGNAIRHLADTGLTLILNFKLLRRTVHQNISGLLRKIPPRSVQAETKLLCKAHQCCVGPASVFHTALPAKHRNGSVID